MAANLPQHHGLNTTNSRAKASMSPAELNQTRDEVLNAHIVSAIAFDPARALSPPAPLAPLITNCILMRVFNIIWRTAAEQLGGWGKQRMLAKVVAILTGGKYPARADAERPGQNMQEFISRYKEQHRKLLDAEKAKARRAAASGRDLPANDSNSTRIALEEELYHCRYGCTPAQLPIRSVPPGLRPQKVEYVTCTFRAANRALQAEITELKKLETDEIKRLATTIEEGRQCLNTTLETNQFVVAERDAEANKAAMSLLAVRSATQRYQDVVCEKKEIERTVNMQETKMNILGAKIAASHRDAACFKLKAEKAMQGRCELERRLAEARAANIVNAAAAARAAEEREFALRKEKAHLAGEIRRQSIEMTKMGTKVTAALMEAASHKSTADKEREKRARVNEQLEEQVNIARRQRQLKARAAKTTRDLRASADDKEKTSLKRLKRAQDAEEQVKAARHVIDELHMKLAEVTAIASDARVAAAEDVLPISVGGRFAAYPWKLRLLLISWLSRLTPPSAIGPNLLSAARLLAPGLVVQEPSAPFIRRCRQEATTLGEACAAWQFAKAKRILSFGFDETTKLGDGLMSTNAQIETEDGRVGDVVLRGAFLIPGGTAQQVSRAVETKLFSRLRRLLSLWLEVFEKKNGEGTWPGPKPAACGYHRLAGSLIMSDTCNAARAAKDQIRTLIADAVKEHLGAEAWHQLEDAEKERRTRSYYGDCMQHLRNIILDAMTGAATYILKEELEESLGAFSSYERMSTDIMQLIRAVFKELHHRGDYAKGKGKDFEHWRRKHHASAFFLGFERAMGGRQDLAFDGALPLFVNRILVCKYLNTLVFTPGHSNILEDFLWHTLSCVEMVALLRVLTLWDLLLSRPLRWLCGSANLLEDWSVYKMGGVLDLVVDLFERVVGDGEVLLDPDIDVFQSIAESQPRFREWRKSVAEETITAADGRTKYVWHVLALNEARNPCNKSNIEATSMTVQLAQEMAARGLAKMRDPKIAIAQWLSSEDGLYSVGRATENHTATVGAHVTNDRVESNFGGFDYAVRNFLSISVGAASGLAQQMRMHHFDSARDAIAHDRRKSTKSSEHEQHRKPPIGLGFYESLPNSVQEAGIEMVRCERLTARAEERSDRHEQAEYREMIRQQNLQLQLETLTRKGALIVERFEAYEFRAERSKDAVREHVNSCSSAAEKMRYLREQIELRVLGFGWSDLATTWSVPGESSDQAASRLLEHALKVLHEEVERERNGKRPNEAPLPDFHAKTEKQLGTRTADATELAQQALCSPEQLAAAIERERKRREAAGFSDSVQATQPHSPPELDASMTGVLLEVCWHYISTEDNQTKVPIWCPCKVVRVANGETDKGRDGQTLSSAARKLAPRGCLLVEFEPDPDRGQQDSITMWLLLDPRKWNRDHTHRAWRYHPEQLTVIARTQRSRRDGSSA